MLGDMTGQIEWRTSSPGGLIRVTAIGEGGSARVQATWFLHNDQQPGNPNQVVVFATPRSSHTQEVTRGVTTSVLRDSERVVVRMTNELPAFLAREQLSFDPLAQLRDAARRLPEGPRKDPHYYRRLLGLFVGLESAGIEHPVKKLVEMTGKPEGTIKTQLRTARQQVRDEMERGSGRTQ
jgi:hypothetical protein